MLKSGMKWIGVIGICLIILAQPLNMIEQTKAQGTPMNQLVDGAITFIIGILPASLSEGASHILYFFFADFPLLVWDVLRMILVMFRSIFADNPEIFNGILAGMFVFGAFGFIFGTIIPILGNIIGLIIGLFIGFFVGILIGFYNWMGLGQPGAFEKTKPEPVTFVMIPSGG